MSRLHALDASRAYYHFIARELGLDPAATKRLEAAEQVNERDVSLTLDDGQVRTLPAHRVRHCDALGPTLGGFKWHVGAGIDSSRAMAAWTTWQCGLFNLPWGRLRRVRREPQGTLPPGAAAARAGRRRRLSGPLRRPRHDHAGHLHDAPGHGVDGGRGRRAHDPGPRRRRRRQAPAAGGSRGHGDAIARSGVLAVRETARAAELDVDP